MEKLLDPNSDELIVVVRRKSKRDPREWLRPYQDRFREAQKVAAEETKDLRGPERVRAMNRLVSERMKGAKP